MFFEDIESRFSIWKKFRSKIEKDEDPLQRIVEFWSAAPLVNKHLDPYRPSTWHDPWQIISEGKYTDLTISIMMGHTAQLTERFANSEIVIKTYIDKVNNNVYNICSIDNKILNYQYRQVVDISEIPENLELQIETPLRSYR